MRKRLPLAKWLLYGTLPLFSTLSLTGCIDQQLRQYNQTLTQLSQGNTAAALRGFSALAKNGHAPSQFRLGLMYLHGIGVRPDPRQGAFWFEKAASQGDIAGQYSLARLYLNGFGVSKNPTLALRQLTQLAERGFVPAKFQLGIMYERGLGTAKDSAKALEWFRAAAEQQHPKAIAVMKKAYQDGLFGLGADPEMVDYWNQKAQPRTF